MAQTFNTSISFVQSTSRKDRRKGAGSLSVSAFGSGVGNVADSATQAWVRNNFVDKTTEQEISAPKIFSQGIKIGDIAFYKHPDGYVYLDETLVLKGGVVMYGNGSGVEVPSIFESLPIDNYTIKRDGNGALYVDETALSVSGGGGGGVADSVYWNNVIGKPSWIGSTKPSYKYSEIEERPDLSVYAKLSDIPSLNGYATQSWVEGKGYLLASTASSTYQSKITSSNKLAYSLISGTPDLSVYALKTAIPTKLSQLTDDVVSGKYLSLSGGTIEGNIRSTGVVRAKYFRNDVLALNSENNANIAESFRTTIFGNSESSSLLKVFRTGSDAVGPICGGYAASIVFTSGDTHALLSIPYTLSTTHQPTIAAGNGDVLRWSAQLLHSGNYSGYALPLSGGILTGNLTAPAFIGNLTGNADSASKLATARTIWGQSFDGTKDITGAMTVDGDATFSSKVVIDGISLRRVDNYLYLDSSLVLSGGVTMYGDDGTTVKPIWESIPFDRTTIDWVNGMWTVVGGTGGGGISEEFLNAKLQSYQPLLSATNKLPYSLISGTPDLSVYATQSWVSNNYLSKSGGRVLANAYISWNSGADGNDVSDWNTITENGLRIISSTSASSNAPTQYSTGLHVKGRYGFQIASAGGKYSIFYIRNINSEANDWKRLALTTDLENYLQLSGGTMTGSITTRSNVYSWANAKTVGHIIAGHNAGGNAAPIISTALASGGYGKLAQVSDQFGLYAYSASDSTPSIRFALYPEDGEIRIMGNTIPMSTTTYNLGSSSARWSNVYATSFIGNLTGNADSATTIYLGNSNANGAFPVPFVSNKTVGNKSLFVSTTNTLIFNPSTGGLSAKNFIGDLTGNADSATYASNLNQTTYTGDVNADDLYGSKSRVLKLSTNANLPAGMNYGNILYIGGGDTGFMLAGSYSRDKLLFRRGTNKNNAAQNIHTNSWKEIAFTDSNVASATKLANKVSLWGNDFDGAASISGDLILPNNNSICVKSSGGVSYSVLKMSTANSLSIGQESASNGRTTMIYGNLIRLRCGTGGTDALYINASGNVTIGTSDLAGATNKMYVDGTAKFTGDTTFSSKVVIGTIPVYQSADGTLFVDANVVFRGGVAMYGNTTTTINEE